MSTLRRPARNPLTGVLDEIFVSHFTELRNETFSLWSTHERFNRFYRVAIDTRPHREPGGKWLRVGDRIEILGQASA